MAKTKKSTETAKKTPAPVKETPKNYKWDPNDSIVITGQEYDVIRKTIDLFRGAQLFTASMFVVDNIFKRMVDAGQAVEYTETPTKSDVATDDGANEALNPS